MAKNYVAVLQTISGIERGIVMCMFVLFCQLVNCMYY